MTALGEQACPWFDGPVQYFRSFLRENRRSLNYASHQTATGDL